MQLIMAGFAYRRAVDALGKSGVHTHGTYDLWLLEEVQSAAAKVGIREYQEWQRIDKLNKRPSFGLNFTPRSLLPRATAGLGKCSSHAHGKLRAGIMACGHLV